MAVINIFNLSSFLYEKCLGKVLYLIANLEDKKNKREKLNEKIKLEGFNNENSMKEIKNLDVN